MNLTKIFSLSVPFFFFATLHSKAQQNFNVCSHQSLINGHLHHYSIGESALVSTEVSSSIIVTQGFLQPLKNTDSQSESENNNHSLPDPDALQNHQYQVYPNPTADIIFVASQQSLPCEIIYRLFDARGSIVYNQSYFANAGPNKVSFDLKNFAAGDYFLTIQKEDQVISSFKIQKK